MEFTAANLGTCTVQTRADGQICCWDTISCEALVGSGAMAKLTFHYRTYSEHNHEEVAQGTSRHPLGCRQIRCILCVQRNREAQFLAIGRSRLDGGLRHLPCLCAGRTLHLAPEDPAHQFLHLR